MPFISVDDGLISKSITSVENRFITKYLPVLEPVAVKVYLYALYLGKNRPSYSISDLAHDLCITDDKAMEYFEYLEEFELISVISRSPFEIKILETENISGTPKKFKPEKYSDFTKCVQNILKGRMISTNEFREYFSLMEDYGFEQDALLMIITYCVNLHGDNIRMQYIKKVAKSFADDGATTAKKVDEKLSAYTSATPSLIKLFGVIGIKKQPDIEDEKLYKKWTEELGFEENAIAAAAKHFKVKTCEKLDTALGELYKNKKFDVKEISDYCQNKNSLYTLTLSIAKNLGVYLQNPAPYVENYVNIWCDFGFSFECLISISIYCFKHGKNSFDATDGFIRKLYDIGIISDDSVKEYLEERHKEEDLLKNLLSACGLTRKIAPWDLENLTKWRAWKFSDEMLFEAAKLSNGKSNPMAYINGILSSWKNEGIFTKEMLPDTNAPARSGSQTTDIKAEIEKHYFDLRHKAESRAEKALASATADKIYGNIRKQLNELSIKLAFAEINDTLRAESISKQISELEIQSDRRLSELNIDKADFVPHYSCSYCNDTGYDKIGAPCICMKKFISELKI